MQALEGKLQDFDILKTSEKSLVPVHLEIPKFKIESTIDLVPILKDLGMTDMFNGLTANFSGILKDEGLFVSKAIQKAFIEVDEVGTTAAAATAVVLKQRGGFLPRPEEFIADHPFLFFLRDLQTGLVLFQGRMVDPTLQ